MRWNEIFIFMVLGALGCKDNPYSERVQTVKRHELSGVIIFPTHQSILSGNNFRDGVHVKAKVSSGMPLTDCRWLIHSEHQLEENLLSGQGIIDGVNCHIEEALDGEKIVDGSYYLKVEAEDVSGLKLNDT